jgi:hypothetical protein
MMVGPATGLAQPTNSSASSAQRQRVGPIKAARKASGNVSELRTWQAPTLP